MTATKNSISAPRVAGLVLAGGQSRRFGREKAVALLDRRPLLAWCAAALAGCCETVAVSAAQDSGAEALARAAGQPVLYDDPGHPHGPLAGLAAGLVWAGALGFDALATLPCDTPRVGSAEVAALIAGLGDSLAAYAVTDEGPHGLCAVWRVSLAPAVAARLAAGDHPAVRRLLADIGAVPMGFADAGPFRNINAEADLSRMEDGGNP